MAKIIDRTVEEIHSTTDCVIVDVRTPEEYEAGHISGSISMPLGDDLTPSFKALVKEQHVVIHCQRGGRSQQWLDQHQDDIEAASISHMNEGMNGWIDKGLPVKTGKKDG